MSRSFFTDRKFRVPREWSNRELRQVAHLFQGDVVNVSGWKDEDKEGRHYRDYFSSATSYTITNFEANARGFQGKEGEIFLDLEQPLPSELHGRFDVVFNHTVLEHVFDVHRAMDNLCALAKDAIILCVPFLQPMHDAHYGDYWRFTPMTLSRLFLDRGWTLRSCTFNSDPAAAVYLFAIAFKEPSRLLPEIPERLSMADPTQPFDGHQPYVGCHALRNGPLSFKQLLKRFFRRPPHRLPDGTPRPS